MAKISNECLLELNADHRLPESRILLAQRRLNAGKVSIYTITKQISPRGNLYRPMRLTDEQEAKAKAWLLNKAYTPTGKFRKNNPFCHNDLKIIENCKEMYLQRFYCRSIRYNDYGYFPVYCLTDGNGNDYSYYVRGGEIIEY